MKYKCLKCGCEFEANYDIKCPDCGAWSTNDIMSLYKYKLSHPEPTAEVPVTGE
jgi:predicted ATP-dependent serine protease